MDRRQEAAFTLLELLVVISIITMLASMLLTGVSIARSAGRKTLCASNLRQILLASDGYSADWRGYRVPAYSPGDAGPANAARHWGGFIQGYLDHDASRTVFFSANDLKPLICPESPKRFGYASNMSCNGLWNAAHPTWGKFVRTATILRTAEKVAYADMIASPSGQTICGGVPTSDFGCWHPYLNSGATSPPAFTVNFTHRRSANIAWVDGHVSSMGIGDGLVAAGNAACDDRWWKRP